MRPLSSSDTSHGRLQIARPARGLRRILPALALMAFAVLCALVPLAPALAQSVTLDVSGLTSATPAGDWSMRMWQSLFGNFASNPFTTVGGPTSLLGGVFIIFNTCVFTLGFTWALYGIVSGVVQTAHEGEVLGKRMSTVWFPIRMVMGIAGMVPIFGGFTLMQAVMMSLTTIGIGIGNSMWTGAVNNTAQFQGLMTTQPFLPTSASSIRDATRGMFMSSLCVVSQAAGEEARMTAAPERMGRFADNNMSYKITYGSQSDPQKCGAVSLNATMRSSSSATSFRTASVDYTAIAQAVGTSYQGAMNVMQNNVYELAKSWYTQYQATRTSGGAIPAFPTSQLDAWADEYIKNGANAYSSSATNQDAITSAAKTNMLSVGWFGAGAWYSTFAEVNAGIADATKGPEVVYTAPTVSSRSMFATEARDALAAADQRLQEAKVNIGASQSSGTQALLDSSLHDTCAAMGLSNLIGTTTGNCSLGQGIVSAALRATAIGSGGGGNGGTLSLDSAGFVNPIIMMKNVGDYVMATATSILAIAPLLEAGSWAAKGISSILGLASVVAPNPATGAAASATGMAAALMSVATTIAMAMLVVGALMSVYIPLIPFITWIGAIVAYAASMIEGLAGASLHAMAHLDGTGEGLGQRTQQGYLFMLNAVLRPGLMLIGFFSASALMIALGTLQAQLFLPAMANVQGNSITGLASIAAFLAVFFVMNVTLISGSFNLIYIITDQVLGFIGGAIDSKLGRETEGKTHGAFLAVGHFAPRVIDGAKAGVGAAKKAANDKTGKVPTAKPGSRNN